MYAQLYNPKTIEKKYSKITITNNQRKVANEWIKKLKNKELEKERKNYFVFRDVVLRDLLGYPEEKILYEEKNVEFSIQDEHGDTGVCFEAKGTKTKDLFARQGYEKKEQESPVVQTLSDMKRFPASYGVCTNYNNFVLLDSKHKLSKCHRFNFLDIKNNEKKLKEFIGIFSYKNLVIEKTLDELYESSVSEEREFTKEFYKLYHETRLMLIKAIQEKEKVSMEEAIHYAQLFLNRLIFVFFASDKGDIESRFFTNRVLKILDSEKCSESSKLISDEISKLFKFLDKGSDVEGIFGFNGGLFEEKIPTKIYFFDLKNPEFFKEVKQYSKLSKRIQLDELSSKIVKKYKNRLNPVISNLLIMDSFDFNTEINVDILGHVFEQSISDLEELKKQGVSKRKKEGIFYTPEHITEYICTNTIIPYLSDNNASTIQELIREYFDNIEKLERKIREIKILDPACGSGAFLVKATEILLEIDKEIQSIKPQTNGRFQLEEWSNEKEITKIIEKNIFGVDINEESVEITKLSLLLKMTTPNKKLSDLSNNIRIGNSIVSDKKIDSNALNWKKEFSGIFKKDGFNIIVGNPPYVFTREKIDEKQKEFFAKNYETSEYQLNTYILFIERSIKLLRSNGLLSFIIPDAWLKVESAKKLRKFMFENTYIKKLVNIRGETFPGVSVESSIFVLEKTKQVKKTEACTDLQKLDYTLFSQKDWLKNKNFEIELFSSTEIKKILDKIVINTKILDDVSKVKAGLQAYENGKGNPQQTKEDVKNRPFDYDHKFDKTTFKYLEGKNLSRYSFDWKDNWLRYGEWLAAPRKFELFSSPRLLVREIPARPPYAVVSTYIEEVYLNNRSIINVLEKDKNFDLKYILSILNSKLMTFYHHNKSVKAQREIFPKITLNDLRKFPIKIMSDDYKKPVQERIINFVNLRFQNESKIVEERKEFLEILTTNYNTKINNKLKNFNNLKFEELVQEIVKQKINIPLEKQAELRNFFTKRKQSILQLETKSQELDTKIDDLVFQIYEINNEEKKIIEESIQN